eukprot:15280261-Ditylum_brightwellii.AAC.1
MKDKNPLSSSWPFIIAAMPKYNHLIVGMKDKNPLSSLFPFITAATPQYNHLIIGMKEKSLIIVAAIPNSSNTTI